MCSKNENKNLNIYNEYQFNYLDYKNGQTKYSLRPNTALNILRAFDFAKYIGTPLNQFITIKFIDNDQFSGRYIFSKIRETINRWLNRISIKTGNKLKPTWVFIFENPNDHFHVHWCIYIPNELKATFRTRVEKLLEKHQNYPLDSNQLNFKDVNPYTDKTIANYICKGVRPDFIEFFHLQNRASFQGYIIGQRARVSQNLGPRAIKRNGFEPRLQRHYWEKLHPEISIDYEKPLEWSLDDIVPQLTEAKKFPGFREFWINNIRRERTIGRLSRLYEGNKVRDGALKNKLNEHISHLKTIKKQLH